MKTCKIIPFILFVGVAPLSAATIYTGGGTAATQIWESHNTRVGPDWRYYGHSFEVNSSVTLAAFTFEGRVEGGWNHCLSVGVFHYRDGVGSLMREGQASMYSSEVFSMNPSVSNYSMNLRDEFIFSPGIYWFVFAPIDKDTALTLIGTTNSPRQNIDSMQARSMFFEGPCIPGTGFLNFTLQDTKFVPEPSVVLIAALGTIGLLRRKRSGN